MDATKTHAALVSALFIGLMVYPAIALSGDSYPLSTYPMFSIARPAEASVTSAFAVGPDFEAPIAPSHVGNSEVMQAMQTIRKAVRRGRAARQELCKRIANNVATDPDLAAADHVSFATLTYHSVRYLGGDHTPLSRRERTRCKVPR